MIKQTHARHQGYAATRLAGRCLCLCFLFMGCASDQNQPEHASGGGEIVSVGQGTYTTALPEREKPPSNQAGQAALPLKTDGFTGPVPTNDWWTSLVWNAAGNAFSDALYAHPLALQAQADGLDLRYPTAVEVDEKSERKYVGQISQIHRPGASV